MFTAMSNRLIRRSVSVVLCLSALALEAEHVGARWAHADRSGFAPQSPPSLPAAIGGRVLRASDGAPLRHASVALEAQRGGERQTSTDADGYFGFTDVAPGSYIVRASAIGHVSVELGEDWSHMTPGRWLTVSPGAVLKDLTLALPTAGVVVGRVVDESGAPLEGVRVAALISRYAAGREIISAAGSSRLSDDRGAFRLFGLAPGAYYVSATPGEISPDAPGEHISYAIAFYPGVLDVAQARPVEVVPMQETHLNDIVLPRSKTFAVSGTVLSQEGAPAAGVEVVVTPAMTLATSLTAKATTTQDGRFRLRALSPGAYLVQALPASMSELGFAAAMMTVAGEVPDFRLQLRPAARIRGTILFEGGKPDFTADEVQVTMRSVDFTRSPIARGARARVDERWNVEFRDVWGPHFLHVSAPNGWALKAVRSESRDVTDKAIEFSEDVQQLEIVLSNRPNSVSGVVTDARGEPVPDGSVLLFKKDPQSWILQQRVLRRLRTDEKGRFAAYGLAPGDYFGVALDRVRAQDWPNPRFLDAVRPLAIGFSLGESDNKQLELAVQARPMTP
jgi:protocatechuate 3,4-dioxygenase beta subunit